MSYDLTGLNQPSKESSPLHGYHKLFEYFGNKAVKNTLMTEAHLFNTSCFPWYIIDCGFIE